MTPGIEADEGNLQASESGRVLILIDHFDQVETRKRKRVKTVLMRL